MKREKYNLKVADIIFEIDTFCDSYTKTAFENYLTTESDECSVKVVCNRTTDQIPVPQEGKLTEREETNWYSDGEGRYTLIFRDVIADYVCGRLDYDNSKKSATIVLADVAAINGDNDEFFLYNVLERLFRIALVFHGGITVHASSIIHDGFGVAFSALSGTGKSTHTGLWQKVYPDTFILNDDAPALRCIDGVWHIYGTPWAGTTGINANEKAPLKALVFLERSEYNTIRDMSALEGIKRLFEAIIHPVSDELMNIVLATVSSFISSSQMCVLGCNMTDDAPRTVREFLYQ